MNARNGHLADSRTSTIAPVASETAPFVVTIDGKPYAGFVDRFSAEQALQMWRGEIDAGGEPVPPAERERRAWPAVRGRELSIVER
jgi:hypothetical protein